VDDKHNATVLIVEDEVFVRMIAADSLADEGFVILEAGHADEALALLAQHPQVAILFTDINMPGEIDGLQLADTVAALYPNVRVVVTSGRERVAQSRLPDHGIYLAKPYSTKRLAEVVHAQARS